MSRGALILALAAAVACSEAPVTQADAAQPIAADAQASDASADAGALPELTCACDPDEDCPACFRHLGECCYGDATFGEQVEGIVAMCERQPSCKACCKECLALSCDEIKARDSCPNLLRE